MKEGLNVLSLFDGISSGRVALERAGIPVANYYASEVDKYAIQVTQKNYPDTIQLGNVKDWRGWELPKIDLIIGGSPCQGFSFAGNQLNFDDPRSVLFFEFVDILRAFNPEYFLLENVKMKQEYQDIISERLGEQPIEINSNLVSAQNRRRLYWTNIPGVEQPEDRGIMLEDVIHENECQVREFALSDKEVGYMLRGNDKWMQAGKCRLERYTQYEGEKSFTLTANTSKGVPYNCLYQELNEYVVPFDKTIQILDKEVEKGKVGYFRKDPQANRVYYIHGKAVTLTGDSGGGAAKMGQYLFGCITPDRVSKRQNGRRFNGGKKFYTLTAQDKHGILIEGYIRKLTPVECERLQTLPDGYTEGISKTQRYKTLGNGWTVDVIAHILRGIIGDNVN